MESSLFLWLLIYLLGKALDTINPLYFLYSLFHAWVPFPPPFCFLFSVGRDNLFAIRFSFRGSLHGKKTVQETFCWQCTEVRAELGGRGVAREGLIIWMVWSSRGRGRGRSIRTGEGTWGQMVKGPTAESQCAVY